MRIEFFDDPQQQPKGREDVRIKQIGLYVHSDERRVTFGVELTHFLERPSIQVELTNGRGEPAGALSVIETLTTNFSLIIHLRDGQVNNPYQLVATVYYATPESDRQDVDRQTVVFDADLHGEKIFKFD